MKSDDPVSSPTNPKPPADWLRKIPLDTKPTTPAVASRSKPSQPFNALAHAWETSLRKHQPTTYHKPLGFKEGCILANFGRAVGQQAREVIDFAIPNWEDFVWEAKRKNGLFGSQPAEPHIKFFVKYYDCAVNLLRQSNAPKKQKEEREGKRQTPGTEVDTQQVPQTTVERRPENIVCIEDQTSISAKPSQTASTLLFFNHQQVAFMCDLSKDQDAFFDKIHAKYGECIMRGLASKELLAGEVVMDKCNGSVSRAVLCDIPVTPDNTQSQG
jgi:hypothetical protein